MRNNKDENMARIALIIFDLDGTLANSLELVIDIYNQNIAKDFRCKLVDKSKIEQYRTKPPTQFFREFGITPVKFPFILLRAKRLMQQRIGDITAFDGITEMIQSLHKKQIKLGVVTSNSTANAHAFLGKYDLLHYFEFVKGSHLLKKKHRNLRQVLKEYPYPKENILYIGDEVRDIVACRKVGLACGVVTWGQANRQLLEQHDPEFIFEQPAEIVRFFD